MYTSFIRFSFKKTFFTSNWRNGQSKLVGKDKRTLIMLEIAFYIQTRLIRHVLT